MRYYANYRFRRSESNCTHYVLQDRGGEDIGGMVLTKDRSSGERYLKISVPRNPAIRRYFAYTLELSGNRVLSSVESFGLDRKTFGDAKSIGESAVLLLQFTNDMKGLDVYFVRSLTCSKDEKIALFTEWRNGEPLEVES